MCWMWVISSLIFLPFSPWTLVSPHTCVLPSWGPVYLSVGLSDPVPFTDQKGKWWHWEIFLLLCGVATPRAYFLTPANVGSLSVLLLCLLFVTAGLQFDFFVGQANYKQTLYFENYWCDGKSDLVGFFLTIEFVIHDQGILVFNWNFQLHYIFM